MPSNPRTLSATSCAIPRILGAPGLVPISLSGTESLNALFDYQLLLSTPDTLNHLTDQVANFHLDDFIGHDITVSIAQHGNAGAREISGLISAATILRQEGRHALYQLTLRPWLHLATLTADCKIFQDQTVVEILDTLLADYLFPVDKRLIDAYPKRDYQTQYNETDFAFFSRLCEEWGINYFFEHSDGKHRLILIDNIGAHKKSSNSAYHVLDFHTEGKHIDVEYIHDFVPAHTLTSGQFSTNEYDYTRPNANLSASRADPRQTGHNQQAVYQWHADAHYSQPAASGVGRSPNDPHAEGDFLARLRMQALRSPGQRARGQGHLRGMVPGCVFALRDHPQVTANADYLILSTTLSITDAADETQNAGNLQRQRFAVNVAFTVQPTCEIFRPERTTPKPFTHGPASATVVGPAGHNLWTDTLGRIKIQFPWDRLGQHNQNSSCWVRVAAPWAGNQLGGMQIPRIGQEVIIDFFGGDPDLPICTGRVYHQNNLPPWTLPSQSALSGFRSRELTKDGGNSAPGRSNHLIMDDTDGKIQSQLKSDHLHSQLSLGHITRIDGLAGRKDARGQGFELRTDGHGAIRAKDGLLISTEGRSRAEGHVTDLDETAQRLMSAQDQHDSLGELAQQHGALETEDHSAITGAIQQQNTAIQGSRSNPNDASEGRFPELTAPHLILASLAGIETTTPHSTHLASGEQLALTSGQNISLSVGQRLVASVKNGIRLFAYKTGIKLVAASGDIDVTSLKDCINLLAKLTIAQSANRITLSAKEEVLINGGGSFTKWNASEIYSGTNGSWIAHATVHAMPGPSNVPVELPQFPQAQCKECQRAARAVNTRLGAAAL
ncbi:type VI secretion system Vgr family protein [Glaciimonas sp. GG7]